MKKIAEMSWDELSLVAKICPTQSTWPAPETLHFKYLHQGADYLRGSVSDVHKQVAEIEQDTTLSAEGKTRAKQNAAAEKLKALEASRLPVKWREAADHVLQKWNQRAAELIKPPVELREVDLHREIRAHVKTLTDGERLSFIAKHADPITLSALLTAETYLWGGTDAELNAVKAKADALALPPEISIARKQTMKAVSEMEHGWSRSIREIAEMGGLTKDTNGGWSSAA